MRQMFLYAAALAVGLVAIDHAVAPGNAAYLDRGWTIDRTAKSDRAPSGARLREPAAPTVPPGPAAPTAREMPDGCEAAISPLVIGAKSAAVARCIA